MENDKHKFLWKKGDQFNTFTFRDAVDEEHARRDWKNFLRRVKRYRKKDGNIIFRYLYTVEKAGQWHIYAIMNGIPLEALTRLWDKGRVTSSILDDTNDYKDLAVYLSKRTKAAAEEAEERRKHSRSWSGNRNLARPEVRIKEIKKEFILKKPPKAPKGYILLSNWEIGCTAWGCLYQKFICKK